MAVGVRYAHPDLDEVGKNKKMFYKRIFSWNGLILALLGKQSAMQRP